MNKENNLSIDLIIEKLLSVKGQQPNIQVNLTEDEIKYLI